MHVLPLWRRLRPRARKPAGAAGAKAAVPEKEQHERGTLPRFIRPLQHEELRSLPDDTSGWWVIFAELLAVVILLLLAANAGSQARRLSTAIDKKALADLTLSDPLAVCVNGAETLKDWSWIEGPLELEPEFAWPNGTAVPPELWSLDYNLSANSLFLLADNATNIAALRQTTLAAMRLCGVLTGFVDTTDMFIAIENGNASQLPLSWAPDRDYYHDTYDPLVLQNMTVRINDRYSMRAPLLVPASFWTTCNASSHQDCCIAPLATPAGLCWDAASKSFVVTPARPEVARGGNEHTICSFGLDNDDAWIVRLDISIGRIRDALWLQIGQQNATTAACLAQHAAYAAELVRQQAIWFNASSGLDVPVSALNMSVTQLRVWPGRGVSADYECANGIDMTALNAPATLTKLAAFKGRAKAELNTTLFVSMRNQSYDDVYAVYTGILGALFGAFALLVATLFVYALAALERMLVF